MAGAAQNEIDEIGAPQFGIGDADLPGGRADPLQRFEADREDRVFLFLLGCAKRDRCSVVGAMGLLDRGG